MPPAPPPATRNLIVRAGGNVAQEAPNDHYLKLGPIAADQAAKFTLHLLAYL